MNDPKNIPQHIAIIMDGNGRWARSKGLPKIAGHRAGARRAEEAIEAAGALGVKVLTLYTFSTENWKRPRHEVAALFNMLGDHLDKQEARLNKNNVKFSVIGDIEALPAPIKDKLNRTIYSTRNNTGLVLNLALNYGSRLEMIRAVRRICEDVKSAVLKPDEIDESLFSKYLYTADLPDPDLLIRTSGEYRISNFLLWQISYAELYVTKKLWPDFSKKDLKRAITEYQRRERRFGG